MNFFLQSSFSHHSNIFDSFSRRQFQTLENFNEPVSSEIEESFCSINKLEEVFGDHLQMRKRIKRKFYGCNLDINDKFEHTPLALTDMAMKLFSKAVPCNGLDYLDMDYVTSASLAAKISPSAMILAMMYLERLQLKNSDYLESVSPSGLFLVTMLVASKFLFEDDEDVVSNELWAEALSIDVKELNNLERNFLKAIDWTLFIKSSDYFEYLSNLEKIIAIKESSSRGWLSYSEAYSVLKDTAYKTGLLSALEQIMKVLALSTVVYGVTVLSLYATLESAMQNKCVLTGNLALHLTASQGNVYRVVNLSEDSHAVPSYDVSTLTKETGLSTVNNQSILSAFCKNNSKLNVIDENSYEKSTSFHELSKSLSICLQQQFYRVNLGLLNQPYNYTAYRL